MALTHGHTRNRKPSRTYVSWQSMLARVRGTSNQTSRKYYKDRGIGMCDEWLVFENFLADMGERPPNRTLDRVNNNLGYFKGNCRWATVAEQNANKRGAKGEKHPQALLSETQVRAIRARVANGERQSDLAREYGVTHIYNIVARRLWKHVQ